MRQSHAFTITDKSDPRVHAILKRYVREVMEISGAANFANSAFGSLTLNADGSITIAFSWLARGENSRRQ